MGTSITAKNISKKYGDRTLFENLSLEIQRDEMVAIMGKSGSGKTTLINMLGLIEPTIHGNILYNDEIINYRDKRKIEKLLQKNIGYLFQNFALLNEKSVSENLKLALSKKAANKTQKMLDALEKVGLKNTLDEKVYHLSGGEQQRVAIARLFLKECDVVFADEPTGSLDEASRDTVLVLLKELQKAGKTIIIVTHDAVVGNYCDRIIDIT